MTKNCVSLLVVLAGSECPVHDGSAWQGEPERCQRDGRIIESLPETHLHCKSRIALIMIRMMTTANKQAATTGTKTEQNRCFGFVT